MPHKVRCPRCQASLLIPAGTTSLRVSCPRCLAPVSVARAAQADQPENLPLEIGAPLEAIPCRHCGRPVQPGWRACPHCGKRLDRLDDQERQDLPDRDVRRDETKMRVGLAVLGLLALVGTLGVVGPLVFRGGKAAPHNPLVAFVSAVFLLMFFGVAASGVFLVKVARDLAVDRFGCGIVFMVVGICMAICGFALFVLAFVVCGPQTW
jgi:endogenous inhibitor of DNA gyrase (YacG/DUF329 family)